jgi:hypothetical protein
MGADHIIPFKPGTPGTSLATCGSLQLGRRNHAALRADHGRCPLGREALPALDQRMADPQLRAQLCNGQLGAENPMNLLSLELGRERPPPLQSVHLRIGERHYPPGTIPPADRRDITNVTMVLWGRPDETAASRVGHETGWIFMAPRYTAGGC